MWARKKRQQRQRVVGKEKTRREERAEGERREG